MERTRGGDVLRAEAFLECFELLLDEHPRGVAGVDFVGRREEEAFEVRRRARRSVLHGVERFRVRRGREVAAREPVRLCDLSDLRARFALGYEHLDDRGRRQRRRGAALLTTEHERDHDDRDRQHEPAAGHHARVKRAARLGALGRRPALRTGP